MIVDQAKTVMTDLRRGARSDPWLPALFFLTTVAALAILPVLPELRAANHLSGLQTAMLLSIATLATLLVSLPLGWLSDRLGTRTLIACGFALCLSCLLVAIASSFPMLLAGRALFGVSDGIIWTCGLVAFAGPRRPAGAMGIAMAIGGAGALAGPLATGLLADTIGAWVAWLAISALAACATIGLLRASLSTAGKPARERLRPRTLLGDARMLASLALVVLSGLVGGIANLLAPQQLDANGVSQTAIGAIFAGGALVWIITATALGRTVDRRSHSKLAVLGCGALALAWLVPVVNLSTPSMALFLLVSTGARAAINTVMYLLARSGASASGNGAGAAIGMANLVFSAAAMSGPLLVALAARSDETRLPYAAMAAVCVAVTVALALTKVTNERRVI